MVGCEVKNLTYTAVCQASYLTYLKESQGIRIPAYGLSRRPFRSPGIGYLAFLELTRNISLHLDPESDAHSLLDAATAAESYRMRQTTS
ncbi:hypothetical protein Vi05172_g2912 [Venturia inaequalis]|nr:hypothetical protein Vi05172_g2912 [Venturia inaequalis]